MDDWLELCRKALNSDDVLSVAPRDEFAKMLNAYDALRAELDAARAQLQADDQRAWEALGKPEGTHDTTNVQRLCAEVERLRAKLRRMSKWHDEIADSLRAEVERLRGELREVAAFKETVKWPKETNQ